MRNIIDIIIGAVIALIAMMAFGGKKNVKNIDKTIDGAVNMPANKRRNNIKKLER